MESIIESLHGESVLWNIIILVILIDLRSFVLRPFAWCSFVLRSFVLRAFVRAPFSPAFFWRRTYVDALLSSVVLLLHSSDDMYGVCPWSSWTIPEDIVVETGVKNCSKVLKSREWEVTFWKSNFNCNLQKHFVYVYEVIIKCYPNFITCLYFPLALIRWNSTHCYLIYPI